MANIRDLYDSKYGPRLGMVLRSLGGDPEAIKSYWQDRADNPDPTTDLIKKMMPRMASMSGINPEVDQIHFQIIREIEHLYFAGTPREVAVHLANALLRCDGQFCIVPGERDLTYNVDTFFEAWNKHNPDQPPIIAPAVDIG